MSNLRWDPFASLDDMFARMPGLLGRWPRLPSSGETTAEWSLKAQLPAVKREDVHLTYDDGMLTISGERRQETEQKGEKFHRIESFHGSFSRSFSLPDAINASAIRAEARDGVVTVHVPKSKAEAKKPTEIKIQ